MRIFILALLCLGAICEEMAVTKEYTDYLKRHVEWEVVDYEENLFRGWTMDEAKVLMGLKEFDDVEYFPVQEPVQNLPSSINWAKADCDHEVRNQGNCGSCWAFATTGMLSDRCCMKKSDEGWLAPQELVSCDKVDQGCNGGWCTDAMRYVQSAHGLVPDACFPYQARGVACPRACADGSEWKSAHKCDCKSYATYTNCNSIQSGLSAGPITLGFGVCRSFLTYKSGVYKCDCGSSYIGLHAVLGVGFRTEGGKLVLHVKNSWGPSWGMSGFFDIFCDQCGIGGRYPKGNMACTGF